MYDFDWLLDEISDKIENANMEDNFKYGIVLQVLKEILSKIDDENLIIRCIDLQHKILGTE